VPFCFVCTPVAGAQTRRTIGLGGRGKNILYDARRLSLNRTKLLCAPPTGHGTRITGHEEHAPNLAPATRTPYPSTCARNFGAFRNFVACSKLYASLIKTGSLHARPKNEIPTGKPKSNPAVTLIFG
jgi:hypothetical protein